MTIEQMQALLIRIQQLKKELAEALGLNSVQYAFKAYVQPMMNKGLIKLTIPEIPNSRKQKYIASIKI